MITNDKANNTDMNTISATKNVGLNGTSEVGESLPLTPDGKPSSATPSAAGYTPAKPPKGSSRIKKNYEELKPFIPKNSNEENYALLTHYLMMEENEQKTQKRIELIEKFDFEESKLTEVENFFKTKEIPFTSKKKSSFTFIDLFAGIGGFRLAMQANGGRCVFSSEWDDAAKQTYYENYGEVPFGDITKDETKALIPEHFDVLCAGFPCQAFSNAGLKKGIEDTRGTLFYHIAEILSTHKPKAVFLENVRGLISNDNGNTIRIVLKTITSMGYKCNISSDIIENGSLQKLKTEASKLVLSAKDYGVPQNRPRIYIVLWREDIAIENFLYPIPQKKKITVGSILEKSVSNAYTISDRLWAGHQKRRIENQKKGNGFGYCLFNSESPYTSTISRRYYKDGSEVLIEQVGKNPRKITPREAANLQGFPQAFHIPSSDTKAYQQFGNSVAVPVVQLVSEQIVKQILMR